MRHPVKNGASKKSPIKIDNVRVLIIEDDQFLRDLSSKKLAQDGFAVDVAIDGEEGYKKICTTKPDIVLLDIILPGIDGFEILRRIRAHEDASIKATPMILLSNLGQESDVMKGERLGADDYLIKANFTIDEIIEKMKAVLEKRRS
jgi:DNA-binding response OmpR family regulator